MLRKIPLTTALMALFAFGVLLGAACSDDDDDAGAQDGDLAAVQSQADKTMVLAAANGLSALGLHDLDDEFQVASEIPAGAAGDVVRAHQITIGTNWPEDLVDQAAELETALEELEAAVEDEDLGTAKGLATETHEAWHTLDGMALEFYSGEAHDEHGEDTEDDQSAESGEEQGEHATKTLQG